MKKIIFAGLFLTLLTAGNPAQAFDVWNKSDYPMQVYSYASTAKNPNYSKTVPANGSDPGMVYDDGCVYLVVHEGEHGYGSEGAGCWCPPHCSFVITESSSGNSSKAPTVTCQANVAPTIICPTSPPSGGE